MAIHKIFIYDQQTDKKFMRRFFYVLKFSRFIAQPSIRVFNKLPQEIRSYLYRP